MAIERTFSIIKPDATARNLTGAINAMIEQAGLRIVAQKRVRISREQAETFYAVHKARPFFGELVDFMISGPVVVQVLEGDNAIAKYRDIMGATDPAKAVKDADVVYTDVWVSMGKEEQSKERLRVMAPYQVTAKLFAAAKPDALFMHCLPAHRGEEVTASVIDGPQSVVWDEAENRLHVQKAILAWCLQGRA